MLLSSLLVSVICGGIGYLLAQWRPTWFQWQAPQSMMSLTWVVVLLLAGAMRAVLVVYGTAAALGLSSMIIGFIIGVWLARRETKSAR